MKTGIVLALLMTTFAQAKSGRIVVGTKNFTEGYILGEVLAQAIERQTDLTVDRRLGLGGTGITFQALLGGDIDVYSEYTGTLSQAILHSKEHLTLAQLRAKMEAQGIYVSSPLGLNNTYALAVTEELSRKLNLRKMSQLKEHPQLRMAFSYEFMERKDGFPAMARHYALKPASVMRMEHALVYSAVAEGKVDVIEVYSTDAKLKKYGLVVLEDDRSFFPKYQAIYLVRKATLLKHPELLRVVEGFGDAISDTKMLQLNALVENSHLPFADAATSFFDEKEAVAKTSLWRKLARPTRRHLLLVFLPLSIAILIGVPLGIAAAKLPFFGQAVLLGSGLIQTIPSLALLCFLIPFLGIGLVPSIVALVLYALLPIVRGTYSGLISIDRRHHELCRVLGLKFFQKLVRIELPLASVHVLSGIKTAAVMTVGMATLAAFIGAGGYGALIVTGLALNDNHIILQGALPAAIMAIVIHYLFEIVDRFLVPEGIMGGQSSSRPEPRK